MNIDKMIELDKEMIAAVKKADEALQLFKSTPVEHPDRVKNLLLLDDAREECFKVETRIRQAVAAAAKFSSFEDMRARVVPSAAVNN